VRVWNNDVYERLDDVLDIVAVHATPSASLRSTLAGRSLKLAAFVARNGPLDHFVRCANRFSPP
jgi:hypothetical protein